tara:strand:+ start:1069 stop:2292 length:1224 start_codon:yes stop_codon:yes gene_type:complete
MKHTLAQNKQLFNVKAIADSKTYDALADGEFGVFAEGSDTSLAASTVFAALPEKFRFVSKLDGKIYYSFDTISKSSLAAVTEQAYSAPVVNIWEGVVASTECDCIATATITVNLDEESLMRERGLSWVNRDISVVSSPSALTAQCDCSGNPTYDNMVITNELFKQVNSSESPFYLAKVRYDVTGLTTYADDAARDAAIAAPAGGEVVLNTADTATQVYDLATTAWVDVAPLNGYFTDEAAVVAFVAATKAINTDETSGTDSGKLILVIEAKPAATRNYKDLDVNYIFPRGTKLTPSIKLNGEAGPAIEFTETQEIAYELGAGADVRAEEFECMSLYTSMNHYPQLSDGLASDDLIYQFVNGAEYNTVNFEFSTDKVNRNDGDKRSFAVMLGTDNSGVFTALKALMGA